MSEAGRIEVTVQIDILGLDQFDKVAAAAQRMATGTDNAAGQMEKSVGRFERLRSALDALEQKYDGVFRAGFRLQAAGRDLAAVGEGILEFLQEGTDQWGDFEWSMNRAAGALEIFDTTLPIYERLEESINKVAREARIFPAEEIAQGMYFWGSTTGQVVESQKDLNILMDGLIPLMKTAAVTNTGYETTIKGVYSILQQYNLGLEDTEEVTNKLLYITNKTAAEFPDLINSFKMVGPVAASTGATFDDMVILLGRMADAGIRGTQSGRAFRQMFIKLVKPTATAKKALDDAFLSTKGLGKSFDDLVFPDGKFVGTGRYLDMLAAATENMTQKQRGHLLATITTANELPVLTKLIDQQIEARRKGISVIDQEKFALQEATMYAEGAFNLLSTSWLGITGLLSRHFEEVNRLIGEHITDSLKPMIMVVIDVVAALIEWAKANEQIVAIAVKIAGVIGVAFMLAGAFLAVVGSLILFGAGLFFAVQALGLIIAIFGPIIAGFAAITAAVAFLTQEVIRNWKSYDNSFIQLKKGMQDFIAALGLGAEDLGTVWRAIADDIGEALDNMLYAFAQAVLNIGLGLQALADNEEAMTVIRTVVDYLIKLAAVGTSISIAGFSLRTLAGAAIVLGGTAAMIGKFVYAVSGLKNIIGVIRGVGAALVFLAANPIIVFFMLVAGAIAAFVWAWENDFGGIRDIVANIWAEVQVIFENAVAVVSDAFNSVVSVIQTVAGHIGGVINEVVEPFVEKFEKLIPRAIEAVQKKFEEWGEKIAEIVEILRPFVESFGAFLVDIFLNRIVPAVSEFVTYVVDNLGPVWESVADIIVSALGIIGTAIGLAIDGFFVFATAVAQAIATLQPVFEFLVELAVLVFERIIGTIQGFVQIVMGIINAFAAILTGDWGKLWDSVLQIIGGFVQIADSIFHFALDMFRSIFWNGLELIRNVVVGVFTRIMDFLWQVPGWVWDVGTSIIKFFWDAITSLVGWLVGNFFGLIRNILVFFIELPGKIWTEASNILPKFWDAISRKVSWVIRKVTGFVDDIFKFFGDLPGKMIEVGKDIVRGIWDGITGLADWIIQKVAGFMGDIWDNVITFWDNHSPSRRMMGLGEQLMQGLAIGLVDEGKSASSAMLKTMDGIATVAEKAAFSTEFAVEGHRDYSHSSSERKVIDINVHVSSDGTVSSENAQTIADAIHQGLMIDRLEHMVTVR